MNLERQLYCGECMASISNKFCVKQQGKDGRKEFIGTQFTLNDQPIEFCQIRTQNLSERQEKQNERSG